MLHSLVMIKTRVVTPARVRMAYLCELSHGIEKRLLVLFYRPEEIVLHLETVVLQLRVLILKFTHQLLVLFYLFGGGGSCSKTQFT